MNKKKIDVSGGGSFGQNPFGELDRAGLPEEKATVPSTTRAERRAAGRPRKRGRVEIRREKSGRGGKTVTTATAFQGVCPAELEEWTSQLRKSCGTGGACKAGAIEIQGDRREDLVRFFEAKGFRPVLAGG